MKIYLKNKLEILIFTLTLLSTSFFFSLSIASKADEINIYSYRQADLIKPLLDKFTAKTGIKTNVLRLQKGLAQRVKAEGVNSPVDVILTVDIGRLAVTKDLGITQKLESDIIKNNIPVQYRDPEGHWFGLTVRGRVVYASVDRVKQNMITYEELADPKWRGKICTRSGQHAYNVALFASMISHHGEAKTKKWLEGVKQNLVRKPDGNDRAQAKAIYAGKCDLGLGNTYYVGLMENNDKKPEQKQWRKAIKVLFPNSEGRGTHANISGMAMAKYAPNPKNAVKFMEFLSSSEAQKIYSEQVFEYPVKPGTQVSKTVQSFGEMKPDDLPLSDIAKNRKTASRLVDEVNYNNGPDN